MTTRAHNAPVSFAFRSLVFVVLATALHARAFAADTPQALVIADLKGDVRLAVRGEPRAAQKGNAVDLPATIRTGRSSSIELQQGQTTVAAGADTQLDIPATAVRGDLLERVVQSSGNTFYSVAKRGAKKFRVETPYLVAVVKGTQFNVSVQEDASTVSLFEGALEIRSADGSDVVNIEAGQIAVRRASEARIRVLRMDTGEPVARNESSSGGGPTVARSESSASGGSAVARGAESDAAGVVVSTGRNVGGNAITETALGGASAGVSRVDDVMRNASIDGDVDAGGGRISIQSSTLTADIDVGVEAGAVNVGTSAAVDVGGASVAANLDTGVDLGAGAVNLGASATVEVGGAANVTAGTSAGVDLGAGTVDVGAGAAVDLGSTSLSAGAGAAVDLGTGSVSAGTDVGADLGGTVTAGVGADAGANLGAGTVDLGAGADLTAGGVSAGAALDTGVDLGTGTIDTGASLTAGGTTVETGVTVGGGAIGADVSAGPIDLGLGVDFGGGGLTVDVGGSTSTGGTTTGGTTVGSTVGGVVGGLLGGLGGRRSRP